MAGLLKHAGVGYGAWGRCDVELIKKTGRAEIVAISDEDEKNLADAAKQYPKARLYTDWREMFAREQAAIDSVSISTRDHVHAASVMMALSMGKHVYCQKPLSRLIGEARMLIETARHAGVVTQMGIQIHAHQAYRTAVAAIEQGMIGRVREVHAWSRESSVHPAMTKEHEPQEPPAGLHWDNWLGGAPNRPFKPVYLYTWNGWLDFGNGLLGNVGCHIFDPIVTALHLGPVRSVAAEVPEDWTAIPDHQKQTWPAWEVVRWTFDPTPHTTDEPFVLTWYDGGNLPPKYLYGDRELSLAGSIFVGEKGNMLLPHIGMPELLGETAGEAALPVQTSGDHYLEYVNACLGEGSTSCGFEYAGMLTETVLLGMLAVRCSPKTLQWDSAACRVRYDAQANKYLTTQYRDGWGVAGLEANEAVTNIGEQA